MLRHLAFLAAFALPSLAMAAVGTSPPPIIINLIPATAPVNNPTIVSASLNGGNSASYTSGIASGAAIAPISVQMSDGSTYDGTVTTSGTAGADFSASRTALLANGSTPTCVSSTNYSLNVVASPGPGETGSAYTLSVTVTCNPGSSTSTPALATAANFTTLAYNMDFTGQTQSKLGTTNFNAQDLSQWLDCAGATGSNGIYWYSGDVLANGSTNRCAFSVINDSFANGGNGLNALDMNFTQADFVNYNLNQMQTCDYTGSNCSSVIFPFQMYYEFTIRLTPATTSLWQGSNGILADIWSENTTANGHSNGDDEADFLEIYPNGNGVCAGPGVWPGNVAGCMVDSNNVSSFTTQYHTYGVLVTDNGSGTDSVCQTIDGAGINGGGSAACVQNTGVSGQTTNARRLLIATVGPQCTKGSVNSKGDHCPSNSSSDVTANMDLLIQRLQIWECSSWTTGECTGTLVTSAP